MVIDKQHLSFKQRHEKSSEDLAHTRGELDDARRIVNITMDTVKNTVAN